MTSTSRIRLAVALYLSVLAYVFVTGCARHSDPAPRGATGTAAAAQDERFSIYDLGSTWRDQTGAERTLESLRGKPVLLAMVYTHCTAVCPLSVTEMKRVEAAHSDVRLVVVSLDPEHDSPQRLAEFARERGLSNRWTLLTGNTNDVRDLAATLGIRYRRASADDIAHSNILTLLDADGRVAQQGTGAISEDAFQTPTLSLR